ncbi:MAG TPA: MFS transporter [Gemmatimonadaceae bacterium]|jgi:SHS family lactate transporter-like MFS transporter|nr:MFS transporter [Gemmatimonadaceae bacterium]
MGIVAEWRSFSRPQRAAFLASFLGWTLDAFDYFLMVFVMKAVATEFHSTIKAVSLAVTLTLAMRPLGALVFGALADRFGRRPVLMIDIMLFSVLELASAFAPTLIVLIALRAAFGFAMGGEWGIGASLTMETIPARARGVASGLLQEGYAFGYLVAAIVYGLLFDYIGWRGMFMVGVLPALLVVYIRRGVEESPAWEKMRKRPRVSLRQTLRGRWGLLAYVVVLMTAFNLFSHGTQDIYPTFLQAQRGFSTHMVSLITIASMIGAIIGGLVFGALSERIGRRKAIIAASALALPIIPLWSYATAPVMLGVGAFLMQIAVQGAWGVIPAHLNELSPGEIRGTFPGLAYQLGNLLASANATIQAGIAANRGGDYSYALAVIAAAVAVVIIVITWFGREARGVSFDAGDAGATP